MATKTKQARQLDALAERLAEDLRATQSDIERIERDVVALTGDDAQEGGVPSNHLADEGSDVYERERLLLVHEELRGRLQLLADAQARMEAGTYGTCERCGNPIAPERLDALPFVTLCITCQSEVEEETSSMPVRTSV
jgi:DnaK suppressor protein